MDSLVVNELASHYESRFLRFTPKIFSALGIGRNSVTLDLGGPLISCIPYEFSVTEARLLAVLNNDEVVHFLQRKGESCKLVLTRRTDKENPEPFHIPVRLLGFQRPNDDSNYCFIHLRFLRLPHELKEMLVTHFFQVDQATAFLANLREVDFESEDLLTVFGSWHLSLSKEATRTAERLKILRYSISKVTLFGEFSGPLPEPGDRLEFVPFQGDADCLVAGTLTAAKTWPELQGFVLLELEHSPTFEVVKRLMKHAKTARTPYLDAARDKKPV